MKILLKGRMKIFLFLFFLFMLEQAIGAVSLRISSGAFMMITPGVDLIRQNIATITIGADESYRVTLRDDNGGTLINGYHSLPYRVSYNNGSDVSLTQNAFVVEQGAPTVLVERNIAITILGKDTAVAAAGSYTTTLTVTITGN